MTAQGLRSRARRSAPAIRPQATARRLRQNSLTDRAESTDNSLSMQAKTFDELKTYVGFSFPDEAVLRALHPIAKPHFAVLADSFYERILAHPDARRALTGGEHHVGSLKVTLIAWMDTLLLGPWDHAYFERRSRIGRVHVRIGLPQHYMFSAMNVVRQGLVRILEDEVPPVARVAGQLALGKILDIELAVMLETYREDLLSQQARKERLATFGQLMGSIGHQLRNPLGVIETSAYILNRNVSDADEAIRKHVRRISEQVEVANEVVGGLLDLLHDRPLAHELLRLAEVVQAAANDVTRPEGVRLETVGLDELPLIKGSRLELRQVFLNLIKNAVEAVGEIGDVWLLGREHSRTVEVSVEDSGPGVDPALLGRLFEPLITNKESGIGLGLPLVKRIAERHGGGIRYEPRASGGSRFVLSLPAGEGALGAQPADG